MKEILLSLLESDIVIGGIATLLAPIIVIAITKAISLIKNEALQSAIQKTTPMAMRIFFDIEKKFTDKKFDKKTQDKLALFRKQFTDEFKKRWGSVPTGTELNIADEVIGTLVNSVKKK